MEFYSADIEMLMVRVEHSVFWYVSLDSQWKVSSPIVDLNYLLKKPRGSTTRHRIYFHRTRQIIIQLLWIIWSSANLCSQEDWEIWPASEWHTYFGGSSVHFAQKYWHPVRVHQSRRCRAIQMTNRTMVFQFKKGETMPLTKTPIEKTSNRMKFIGRQLFLRLNFRRRCAQIPRNDAQATRNRLSHEVLRTRPAVCVSSWSQEPIPQISPGDNGESGIVSTHPSGATLWDEFPCPDDYFDAPEDQICYLPSLDHDAVETFDLYPAEIPFNLQIMSRILGTARCFDLIASEISSPKSLSPDLLCLLQRFYVGHCKPAAQNSYW
jgi:hypothetical protein